MTYASIFCVPKKGHKHPQQAQTVQTVQPLMDKKVCRDWHKSPYFIVNNYNTLILPRLPPFTPQYYPLYNITLSKVKHFFRKVFSF